MQSKKSKLEQYLDVLKVLRYTGPLTLDQIIKKASLESTIFKNHIDFLVKQGIVEKQVLKSNNVVFSITQLGTNVLGYFKDFAQNPPLIEDI